MIELRGNRFGISKSPEEILALLEEVAGAYQLSSRKNQPYYIQDHTTIQGLNWTSFNSLKGFLGTWLRAGFPKMYDSGCGAAYLRVKNHYLGFYPASNKIIKIFLDQDAFLNQIEGIRRFSSFNLSRLKAPILYEANQDPIPHTVERLIPGKNYQLLPLLLPDGTIEELVRFHTDQVISTRIRLGDSEKEQIHTGLKRLGLNPEQSHVIQRFLERSAWNIAEGELHGDLSRGNLIQGKDGVYLTDWEGYSRGPIARDLVKLYSSGGGKLRKQILQAYQDKLDSKPADDLDDMASSLLLYHLRLLGSLHTATSDQLERVFQDQEQVNQKLSSLEAAIKSGVVSLLELVDD